MSDTVKRLKVVVTAESPVRVGGSRDPIRGVDLPMAAVGGRPVIPGASLKGALRAELARHLLETGKGARFLAPCIPAAKRSPQEEQLQGFKKEACSLGDEGENEASAEKWICPACYLLGAQGVVGFVRVPFLYASVSQEELTEIQIDVARGTARSGGLRSLEFVPQGATFTGVLEIVVRDAVRGWELGKTRPQFEAQDRWLATGEWAAERIERELVQDRLQSILKLGGFKSKGYGNVSVKVADAG